MFEKKSFREILEIMEDSLEDESQTQFYFQEGSIIRNLSESFAYELAILYEKMEKLYLSAHVDTAEGTDLDKVVGILGIKRGKPEYATGEVTFERDVEVDKEIEIPINTLLSTEDTDKNPKKTYKTIEVGVIPKNISAVTLRIQAETMGKFGETQAKTIITMLQQIAGVKLVYNQKSVQFHANKQETDEELRDRAKKTLLSASGANSTSIKNALLRIHGVKDVRIKEPFESLQQEKEENSKIYGLIDVFVDVVDFEKLKPQMESKIEEVRAAGVYVRLQEPVRVEVDVAIHISIDSQVKLPQISKNLPLEKKVEKKIENYLKQLKIGQPLAHNQFMQNLLNISGINDITEAKITLRNNIGNTTVNRYNKKTEFTLSELAQKKQIEIIDYAKIYPHQIKVFSNI